MRRCWTGRLLIALVVLFPLAATAQTGRWTLAGDEYRRFSRLLAEETARALDEPDLSQQARLLDSIGFLQIMIGDMDAAAQSYARATLHADRWRRRAFPLKPTPPASNVWESSRLAQFAFEFQHDGLVRLQFSVRATDAVLALLTSCVRELSTFEATPEESQIRDYCEFGTNLVRWRTNQRDIDLFRRLTANDLDGFLTLASRTAPGVRQLDLEAALVRDMAWRGQADTAWSLVIRRGDAREASLLAELVDALAWAGHPMEAEQLALKLSDDRQRDAYEAIARSYAADGDLAGLERAARKTLASLLQSGQPISPNELALRSIAPPLQVQTWDLAGRTRSGLAGVGLPPFPVAISQEAIEEDIPTWFFGIDFATQYPRRARPQFTPERPAIGRRILVEPRSVAAVVLLARAGLPDLASMIVRRQADLLLALDDGEPAVPALLGIVDVLLSIGEINSARMLLDQIDKRFAKTMRSADLRHFERLALSPSDHRYVYPLDIVSLDATSSLYPFGERLAVAYGLRHAVARIREFSLVGAHLDSCRLARYAHRHSRLDIIEATKLINPSRNPSCYASLIADLIRSGEYDAAHIAVRSVSPRWLIRHGDPLIDVLGQVSQQAPIGELLDAIEASCIDGQYCTEPTTVWEAMLVARAERGESLERLSAVVQTAHANQHMMNRETLALIAERLVAPGKHQALRHLQAAMAAARIDPSALDFAVARALASAGQIDDALAASTRIASSMQRLQILAWASGKAWAAQNEKRLLRRGIEPYKHTR